MRMLCLLGSDEPVGAVLVRAPTNLFTEFDVADSLLPLLIPL